MGVDYYLVDSREAKLKSNRIAFETPYVSVGRDNTLWLESLITNLCDKIDDIVADIEAVKDYIVEDGYYIYQVEYDTQALKIEVSKDGVRVVEGRMEFVPED